MFMMSVMHKYLNKYYKISQNDSWKLLSSFGDGEKLIGQKIILRSPMKCKTKDFKFFYCPLSKGISREEFHFFWWFGHKWYIALSKRRVKNDR